MYPAERQQEMVRLARRDGRIDVAEIASLMGVTTETVRRDLKTLERQGLVRRVHGGALPIDRLRFEPGVAERTHSMTAEKAMIAKAALAEVPDAGTVLLDGGTTTAALAECMPDDRELTVVTNSLPNALTLSARPRLNVLVLGGRVRGRTLAQVDRWALQALREITVDVAFLGANGVSVEGGLTTPDLAESDVKQAMVRASRRVVLLADHSKIGVDHFATFAQVDEIDVLITDDGLDDGLADEIEAAGPKVVRA